MPNTAQLALSNRVLKMRDDIAQRLMAQEVHGPRVSWIYPAQMAAQLAQGLKEDRGTKESLAETVKKEGASTDFFEAILHASEEGSEKAKTIILNIAKKLDNFYTNMAEIALENEFDPSHFNESMRFKNEIAELSKTLEAQNQLALQNLSTFNFIKTEEITYENREALNQNAPSPDEKAEPQSPAQNQHLQTQQFQPRPTFSHSRIGKDALALAAIEKTAQALKMAKLLAEKVAEAKMQLIR